MTVHVEFDEVVVTVDVVEIEIVAHERGGTCNKPVEGETKSLALAIASGAEII